MRIQTDDLSGPEIAELLREHLRDVALHSPPESVHALDIDALRSPEITFWTAWDGRELLGCGALKELDPKHGEIKSMRTASAHLRRGVARALLAHIVDESRRRSWNRLSLETGSTDAFIPARRLYAAFGFSYCAPFADYVEDPYSAFMTRSLEGSVSNRPMQKYCGSCHCGAIRFEIETDFPELTMCDCSICRRKNALMVKVHERQFTLSAGAEFLAEYQFHTMTARHFFCKTCGIYPFHRKRVTPDYFGINVFCLENFDPAGIPVRQAVGITMK